MIELHYSNRLEELIEPLALALAAAHGRDPMASAVVIVPNQIMAEFIRLRLAERDGVAANLEFPFLHRYLARVVAAADPALRVLDNAQLQLAIFECLRAVPLSRTPALEPVAAYVAGEASGEEREVRLLRLSERIAALLREYAISRAAMLENWRRGPADLPLPEPNARWQRYLYRLLFEPDGALSARWAAGGRFMMLGDALGAAERLEPHLANPLHVFGLSYAGPEFVRMFARLGQLTELHIYCLNPCLEFWEDVIPGQLAGDKLIAMRRSKLAIGLEDSEDPFALSDSKENSALAFWGRPGREYIHLLNELTECDFDARFSLPADSPQAASLLHALQQAILLRQPSLSSDPRQAPRADHSIRVLACPGLRREVESIANTIWSLIRHPVAPGSGRLRFHQIGVLIPDGATAAYLPHFQTVFSELHDIPLNVADHAPGATSRVAEAVELLLRLPMSQLSRDEVIRLLTDPALGGGREGGDQSEQWRAWCAQLGIFFGADQRDLAGTYIPPDRYHWDQGLRRLALGAFMTGYRRDEERAWRTADGGIYLPLETEQDEAPSAARLIHKARRLLHDTLQIRTARYSLARWSDLLCDLLATYIEPPDAAGQQALRDYLGALQAMAMPELCREPVAYPAACELALAVLGQARAEFGRFAQSGVIVGSMSALHSIPFRVLFVPGLGDGTFPSPAAADPLDLRAASRRAGDVTPSERDRYLFLQTVLAARERLFLSYVARNEITGTSCEPSPVVYELSFSLRGRLSGDALKALTIVYPPDRYDPTYWRQDGAGEPDYQSYDSGVRRGARLLALRRDLLDHCAGRFPSLPLHSLIARLPPELGERLRESLRLIQPPRLEEEEEAEIVLPLAALRRFLECPLQGTARYALGMFDNDDEEAGEDPEGEPIDEAFLAQLSLLREAFWRGRGENAAVKAEFERGLMRRQLQGEEPAGPFLVALRKRSLVKLDNYLGAARAAGLDTMAGWQRIALGGGSEEMEQADRLLPPIVLEIPRPGGVRRISLRANLTVSPQMDAACRCLAAAQAQPKDFLDGYLSAFALAAEGFELERFRAIALGQSPEGGVASRIFRPPSPDAARAYLSLLASELLYASAHYFFPIEAVGEIVRRNARDPAAISLAIESVRKGRKRCSSDYGPLRDARQADPLPPALVWHLIERRYGPLLDIFTAQEKAP